MVSCDKGAKSGHVTLQIPVKNSKIVKMILTMNTFSTFVAMVAYHKKINFVTHPKVNLYKRKAKELVITTTIEQKLSNPNSINGDILIYLNNNYPTRFVQILCYGYVTTISQQSVKN